MIDIFDVVFGDLQRAATHRGRKRRAGELRHYDEAVAAVHTRMRVLLDALDDAGVLAVVLDGLRAARGDVEEAMGTVAALMRPPGDPFHERLVACSPHRSADSCPGCWMLSNWRPSTPPSRCWPPAMPLPIG